VQVGEDAETARAGGGLYVAGEGETNGRDHLAGPNGRLRCLKGRVGRS
jgi:hypothetical protein